MAPLVRFHFGDCTVDPQTRSISRGGLAETPEPKVFDLIVFLIGSRDRVVTRQELLAAVWGTRVVVTDGVVARAVMKARRLIGDDPNEPTLIRTIHRVGYRFVSPVREEAVGDAAARDLAALEATAEPAPSRPRVAILPFENETGEPEFDWIEHGLMASVSNGLQARPGLQVIAAEDVIALVGSDVREAQGLQSALEEGLGATDVMAARLERDPAGRHALRYTGHGARLGGLTGTLTGPDVIDLGQRLAATIERHLAPPAGRTRDGEAPVTTDDVGGDDRFVQACHGRAMDAMVSEQWPQARRLLQVVLDIEPDSLRARLDFARCLVWQRDPSAQAFIDDLLHRIEAAGSAAARMDGLQLKAMHLRSIGNTAEAGRLLTAAIEIAESQRDEDAELQMLVTLGDTLVSEGTVGVAAWIIDRATASATRLGNRVALSRLLDLRGRLHLVRQELDAAAAAFEEGAAACERLGLLASSAFCLSHRGYCLLASGRMRDAAECFMQGLALARRSGNAACVGTLGLLLVRHWYATGRDPAEVDVLLDELNDAGRTGGRQARGSARLAKAVESAHRGMLDDALERLDLAAADLERSQALAFLVDLYRVRVLIRRGRSEAAAEACEALSRHANGRLKPIVVGMVMHLRGLLAAQDGRPDEAHDLVREAMAWLPASPYRLEAGLDLAWLQLELDRLDAARETLRSLEPAVTAAAGCGHWSAQVVMRRMEAGSPAMPAAARLPMPSLLDIALPA